MRLNLTLATAAAVLISVSAMAAEMPVKARRAAPPAPVLPWNSCYVGVNGGGAWARSDFGWQANPDPFTWVEVAGSYLYGSKEDPVKKAAGNQEIAILNGLGSNTLTSSGGTAGGQWGCNWQFNSGVVFGYESDLEWTDINATFNGFFPGSEFERPAGAVRLFPQSFTETLTSHWLSTSRFRAGWAAGPVLFYGTAGIAVARITFTDQVVFLANPVSANAVSETVTKVGWTVGGGIEWLIWGNWSVKAEYLYVDLGSFTNVSVNSLVFTNGSFSGATIAHDHNLREQIARVGLNYQLNWGAPAPRY